jgi:hypothetical protein
MAEMSPALIWVCFACVIGSKQANQEIFMQKHYCCLCKTNEREMNILRKKNAIEPLFIRTRYFDANNLENIDYERIIVLFVICVNQGCG